MTKLLLLALVALGAAAAAEQWRLQYFYDEDKTSLAIFDLKFPSARRGIAVGMVSEVKGEKQKPVVLVSGDGGAKWDVLPIKERGLALHFLNDTLGWMVTDGGVWQTEEAGRAWKKLKSFRGLRRVYFISERKGWVIGAAKAIHQTDDGGKTWSKLPAAAEPKSNPEYTAYHTIAFVGPIGMIAGSSRPPRRDMRSPLPEWVDPETAARRREWPALTLLLETRDSGATWSSSSTSMFGGVSKISFWQGAGPEGKVLGATGLALLEFTNSFQYPSEVLRIDLRNGRSSTVYRDKERAITDVQLSGPTSGFAAGYELPGTLRSAPIPGRVKILKTNDLASWVAMDVDYRAVAGKVILARSPEGECWAATDTGMILKLDSPSGQNKK